MTIRLATAADVTGVMALESRYYIGNLDADHRAEGFISALQPREWFEHAIAEGGLHVAVNDGASVDDASVDEAVLGFIAVTEPPPRNTPGLPPLTAAMLDLAATVEFNGAPIAAQRYALRGPVLIAEQARGRGLYTAFNAVTMQYYRDRFDIGVLFVSADNPRSLHTTTTKLGATPLAVFEVDGRSYHFLAFAFNPGEECLSSKPITGIRRSIVADQFGGSSDR